MPDDMPRSSAARPRLDLDRREFLRIGAAAGAGLAVGATPEMGAASPPARSRTADTMIGVPFERHDVVRVAIVGTGLRGRSVLGELLGVDHVRVTALCDVVPEKVAMAMEQMRRAGHDYPVATFTSGERGFEELVRRDDIDVVYTATPWEWHVPVCVAAMQAGKHAATEVPAAYTVEDCWALVDTSERTRRHCVLMENCCYGYNELLVLEMVRAGRFGTLKHAGAAYNHDLREILFERKDEGIWRRAHHTRRNGNLYPTHGLGPIAQCLDINRGNQLDYLVSMSSPSRGLQLWQQEHLDVGDPRRAERYVLGDVNVTLLQTVRGQTIYLVHDTNLPRPYSRINLLQGTRGVMHGWPDRIHVEGSTPGEHAWEPLDRWYEAHEHPLWRWQRARGATAGHGGMDFLEDWRLVVCLRHGWPTDQNVYDAACWSAISELTERSVASRSRPVDVPDFTRGRWRTTPPLAVVGPEERG